jgi:hypothetical protein
MKSVSAVPPLVLQPRKLHFALPLLGVLVGGWAWVLPLVRDPGLAFPMWVLLVSASLALLGFGVGHLQRIVIYLDAPGTRAEVVWEVQTLIGTERQRFAVSDIAEFGMHRQRVKRGYAVRPAILFKDEKRAPFPLLTVSIPRERAVELRDTLNAWLGICPATMDIEIPEDEA